MSSGGASAGVTGDIDEVLCVLLTLERLGSYLRATDQGVSRGLRLYEWNISASTAVLATTGMVETLARTALDSQLVALGPTTPAHGQDRCLERRGLRHGGNS